MRARVRWQFWLETGLATVSGVLFIVTLVWRDWIEDVFGVDPDQHSGSLEWLIVIALLAIALISAALARTEWSRATATA